MSTLTSTRLATLPRVNLLPPEIEEQRRLKRLQLGLGTGVVAVAGIVGVLTVMAGSAVSDAKSDLETAQATGQQLRAEEAQYAEVPMVYAQVDAASAQLETAMGQEIRWSRFLNDISLTIPSKVWLTNMTVTQTVDAAAVPAVAPSAGTYLEAGLGSITFEGYGYGHNDVASWLNALTKQQGLAQPYFTNSTKEAIGSQVAVKFSSQATITEEALSKRYVQEAGS